MNFLSANSANRTADRTVKQYDNLTLCDSLISAHMLWIRIWYRNLKLIHIHFYRGKVWRAAPLRYHSKTVQVMKMAMQELVVVCKCQWQGVVLLRGRSLHRSYTGSLGNKCSRAHSVEDWSSSVNCCLRVPTSVWAFEVRLASCLLGRTCAVVCCNICRYFSLHSMWTFAQIAVFVALHLFSAIVHT